MSAVISVLIANSYSVLGNNRGVKGEKAKQQEVMT